VGAGNRWIPEEQYAAILGAVPIACVDLLPLSSNGGEVGLIYRPTYGGGHGWCLVGGAVLRNERLICAVNRHLTATLSGDVSLAANTLQLEGVFEYLTHPRPGYLCDPRKHSIAINYTAIIEGSPAPMGEAERFAWFDEASLPTEDQYGFGQGRVVRALLAAVSSRRSAQMDS
jgi:ADP-ribose pyrophosphatase YjhB (NUDIX family)